MKIVVQRVSQASVTIEQSIYNSISHGLLVLLGIHEHDTVDDLNWLVQKVVNLRIFADEDGKMNRSVVDVGGEILLISQFTLHAQTKKGNRPSFIEAAKPETAIPLYEKFAQELKQSGVKTKTGIFGADMKVELVNDGPVTIVIDSRNKE